MNPILGSVQDNWSDKRMSEKSLIDYMQRRINVKD